MKRVIGLAAMLVLAQPVARAADGALPALGDSVSSRLQLEGFASLVIGKALDGRQGAYKPTYYPDNLSLDCPCYIANWEKFGVYRSKWSPNPESRYGVQGHFPLTDKLSATMQVVGYAQNNLTPELSWAYLDYRLNDNWSIQAGRKRLPLFYYSDFQDVGYAYPWLRPPTDVYNWHITHFNGVNLAHTGEIGGWSTRANFWYGSERDKDNALLPIYFGLETRVDETWKNIMGGSVEISRDSLNLRAVYMQTELKRYLYFQPNDADGDTDRYWRNDPKVKMQFAGLSANVDYRNWLLRSELNFFKLPDYTTRYQQMMLGVGYQVGKFTPMLTWSRFLEKPKNDGEAHSTVSFSLRYELAKNMALKLQYDQFKDRLYDASYDFVGSAKVLAVGLDMVF